MKIKLLFSTIFVFIFTNVFSQNYSFITGKILDITNQQPVTGAVIEIVELKKKTGSDENGNFKFDSISVGRYSIKVSSIGYISRITENVIVSTGTFTDLIFEMEPVSTEEILVQDERFSKPNDISTSIKNLQYEEIRRTPGGFEDIGRVVQSLPGVSFVNDGRNDLIVRGGSPSENLFLVDNSPIPNINHFGSQGATGGPISLINLDFIREVNFLTGGFSPKYGDKLSSVLDIKLREGSREKFFGDINLSATGFAAVFESPFANKKGSWLFSANRSYLDLIFTAAGFGFIPEYSTVQGKVTYDISKNNFLTVNAIANFDKVKFNNDKEKDRQDNENILKNNQWGYSNSFELKTLLSKKSYSLLNLTRNFTNYDISGRDSNFVEKFSNTSKESSTSLKYEYFYTPGRKLNIEAGVSASFIKFNNKVYLRQDTTLVIDPNTGNGYVIPGLDFSNDDDTYKVYSYLNLTKKLFWDIKLNAGIRYDYFAFINDKNYFSPRTSVSIPLTEKLNLNAAWGVFFQSPSYIWLVSNSQNKDLKNIRANHYVAGIEYILTSDMRFSIEGYYKKYSDYPASTVRNYLILANQGGNFQNTGDFGLEPLVSAGSGYSKGVEFFFQKNLSDNFYGTLNFSYFDARFTALDGIERQSDFNNKFLLSINAGVVLGKGWEAGGKFRFNGGRPYTLINPNNGTVDVSQYNTARLPDYNRFDIRVDKRWNFKKWSLVTYIDIQNLFNKKNITQYKWNKFTKTIEEDKSLGTLPTIGINAQF
ncbi:MAG: TonB-dependent receptor [Ignavibacteria bacterium]|nr:TonB-dependent receptor [Ignavibacteria bacterium]